MEDGDDWHVDDILAGVMNRVRPEVGGEWTRLATLNSKLLAAYRSFEQLTTVAS